MNNHGRSTPAPDPKEADNLLYEYVFNNLLAHIHPKMWAAGTLLVLAIWMQIDFGYFFMLANLLGIGHIFGLYYYLRADCKPLRAAIFRFSLYASLAFLITTFVFVVFGKQPAIYCGYFMYGFITIDYLFSWWSFFTGHWPR